MYCSLCAGQFATLPMLLKHIRLIHADKPNFHLQCNLQGCKRTFKQFSTYRNHIYQHDDVSSIADLQEDSDSSTSQESSDSEWQLSPNSESDPATSDPNCKFEY